MLNREFTPKETLSLWDAIFANDYRRFETSQIHEIKEYNSIVVQNLDLIDFICLAMIINVKEKLIDKDQNECFKVFFKYPVTSPAKILELAIDLKSNLNFGSFLHHL